MGKQSRAKRDNPLRKINMGAVRGLVIGEAVVQLKAGGYVGITTSTALSNPFYRQAVRAMLVTMRTENNRIERARVELIDRIDAMDTIDRVMAQVNLPAPAIDHQEVVVAPVGNGEGEYAAFASANLGEPYLSLDAGPLLPFSTNLHAIDQGKVSPAFMGGVAQ